MDRPSRNTLFDALRGLAAIEVMLFHVTNMDHQPILPGGYLAVDLFFLLSGFVLWNAYGARLERGLSAGSFVRLRLVRLYPLFAVGVALGVIRALGAMHLGDPRAPTLPHLAVEIGATAVMLPSGLGREGLFPLDNPAWSLALEVIVNIAFCVWLVRWSPRRLVSIVAVAALALALVAGHFGSLDIGWNLTTAIGGPVRCTFSFVLGVVMARQRLYVRHRSGTGPLLVIGVLMLFSAILALDPAAAIRPWYDLACVLVVFPSLVALTADTRMHGPAARIGAAMGEMSYPLYATHYPLILPAMLVCARLHASGRGESAMIAVGCVLVAAMLAPVDRAVRSALARRRPDRAGRLGQQQRRVAIGIEAIPAGDRMGIGGLHRL